MTGATPELETTARAASGTAGGTTGGLAELRADAPPEELVAAVNADGRGTLAERMGIEIVEITAERCVATMPVEGNTQPYGLLHGGASCVLAETLGSVAAAVAAGSRRVAVGLDLNATHHRAVRAGTVTAVCRPLQVGRSVASFEIALSDDEGRRVCSARLTCVLRDAPPGA